MREAINLAPVREPAQGFCFLFSRQRGLIAPA